MNEPTTQPTSSLAASLWALLQALRPAHWVKNGFVVAPILFSGRLFDLQAWERCLLAVIVFSLLSSAVYLINDICDRNSDRLHPDKRYRPLASGRLSVGLAGTAAVVLALAGLALAAILAVPCLKTIFERKGVDLSFLPEMFGAGSCAESPPLAGVGLLVWATIYFVLNVAYSLRLKWYTVIDVSVVAFGFVLRAMGGAAAIAVPVSPWLVICTFTFCLFLALAKRRSELNEFSAEDAGKIRRVHRGYRVDDLDFMLTTTTAIAIMSYCLYCLAPRTVERFGSANMIWTIPLVMYGIFRFIRIGRRIHKGDLVSVLLVDRVLWLVVLLYSALSAAIIYFGKHPVVQNILEVHL